jgi:threonylcarbamoyladenosine tRNA methylthiotransferase MtaB
MEFAGVHVFRYSRRKGTAAADMPHQVPDSIKRRRSDALIRASRASESAFRTRNRGKIRQALFFDRDESNCCVGITDNGIMIHLPGDANLENRFVDVEID